MHNKHYFKSVLFIEVVCNTYNAESWDRHMKYFSSRDFDYNS